MMELPKRRPVESVNDTADAARDCSCRNKKIAPARNASRSRGRAPPSVSLKSSRALRLSGGRHRFEGHVTLRRPTPANSAACRPSGNDRRNRSGPSPSECRNRRIPRLSGRRSAIGNCFRRSPRARPSTSPRPGPGRRPMPASARAGRRERRLASMEEHRCARSPVVAAAPRLGRDARGAETMDVAGQLDADPVRLADHRVARRRAEHRSNGARAFSLERHLPQSFNRRIGPHIPRPPLLPCQFA